MPQVLASSIGKKTVLAITGAILYLFVLGHLAGNLQIFLGPDALNAYAEKLRHMPAVLWAARVTLLLALLIHLFTGIRLSIENRRARPQGYAFENTVQASLASRTMLSTGLVILAFVVYHLMHFTWLTVHPEYRLLVDAHGRHDVYSMAVLGFQNPFASAVYAGAVFFLGMHLAQAFQGMFQTFGLAERIGLRRLRRASLALSVLIFLGYASIPAAVLLGILKLPGAAS